MTTIILSHETTDAVESAVRAHLDHVSMHVPDWNGVDFVVERGDFTCIPDDERPCAVTLVHEIFAIELGRAN